MKNASHRAEVSYSCITTIIDHVDEATEWGSISLRASKDFKSARNATVIASIAAGRSPVTVCEVLIAAAAKDPIHSPTT